MFLSFYVIKDDNAKDDNASMPKAKVTRMTMQRDDNARLCFWIF